MHIRSLSIKSINITVYSGEDFAFLKTSPGKLKYVEESVAIELNEDNVVTGVMMLENRKSSRLAYTHQNISVSCAIRVAQRIDNF
jgi:hypothetical protein